MQQVFALAQGKFLKTFQDTGHVLGFLMINNLGT